MEQIECGNASGISLPEAFLYSLLTPTQVLRRLIVVEDVNQQAPAVFYNADVTVEAGVRDGVHASLHHNLTEGEVHHVSCLTVKDIPELARISASTVKTHNRNLYRKLGVDSFDELKVYIELFAACGRSGELLKR